VDVLTQGSLEPIYGSRIDNPPVFTINDLTQIDEAALRKTRFDACASARV
jgi:hypothetical protein